MKALMSVDVEDWFQTENFRERIPRTEWNGKDLRVRKNVELILNILEKNNAKGTFFTLGWIATKVPQVVKDIAAAGHEMASHGFMHECVYRLTPDEFREDIRSSKKLLEDLSGQEVIGYRAPNFSITDWAIEVLSEEGFHYDSSFFPVLHDRYGKLTKYPIKDEPVFKLKEGFYEVPLSVVHLFGKNIPWSGGGYFRLLPYSIFRQGLKRIMQRDQSFNFYIHPWEFDPGQPRIRDMHKINRWRHYNNIEETEFRFTQMVKDFEFVSIKSFIESRMAVLK
jgi:polysaccharide deacetylase family protein (PEP-CTERM system associated)